MDNDRGATRVLCHSERSKKIIQELETLSICEVDCDEAVRGVKEMGIGPHFHPLREAFFTAMNEESQTTEEVFVKYFPITIRHRLEKIARIWCNRLGLYPMMKSFFKFIIGNKEITR